MDSKNVGDKIPPNFLNSILTNSSLYDMFKDEYDLNLEYFQNRDKNEYINAMLFFIEKKLFSGNMFGLDTEECEGEKDKVSQVLNYIRKYYDDFLLDEIKDNPENIFSVAFFKALAWAKNNDIRAREFEEFNDFYDYVFNTSINYDEECKKVLMPILSELESGTKLSISDYDILCNFVKNNIDGYVPMNIVTNMIRAHAYKTNHIFDVEVIKCLVISTARDYFSRFDLTCEIKFNHETLLKGESSHDIETRTIYIDSVLLDTFIFGNYVELYRVLFSEMSYMKQALLFLEGRVDYETFKVLSKLLVSKVDMDRIFVDATYEPYGYLSDLKASAFIKTLRFYQSLGVDLFENYISSKSKEFLETDIDGPLPFKKEVSLEMAFQNRFSHLDKEKIRTFLNKYKVLSLFYDENGYKKRTVDLIKKSREKEYDGVIKSYISSTIIDPETMIDDVSDLLNFKAKDREEEQFIVMILKYIYVDAFYYSLNSSIKMNWRKDAIVISDYLDDLSVRVNCIKDTPLSHKFIDEALFVIEEAKQNS